MCYSTEMEESIATERCGSLLYSYAQYQGNQVIHLEGWNAYSSVKPCFGVQIVAFLPAKSRYIITILYQDEQGLEYWLDNKGIMHAVNSCDIWIDYPVKGEV